MSELIVDNYTAFTPKSVICPTSHTFMYGKYKGRTVEDVIAFDPSYLGWMRSKPWAQNDAKLIELIKDVAVPDLTFGTRKGKTLEYLMANDEGYVKYLYNSDFVKKKHPELWAKVCKIYI